MTPQALAGVEVSNLAESIRALLDDPDANLSRDARLRWEGALTALETVLGRTSSVVPGDFDLSQL